MREQQLQIESRRLNSVSSSHHGPPLLMLHGVTRRWQTFLPLWSSLAVRWQLAAIDFRGHGNSDHAPGGYRVCDYAQDAIAYINVKYDRPVVLYGHSLGAMVAAQAASQLGDRIAAVVLEDPPLHTMGSRIGETPLLSFFTLMRKLAGDSGAIPDIANQLAEGTIHDPTTNRQTRLGDMRDAASLRFTAACLKQLDPQVLEPIIEGRWLDDYDVEAVFQGLRCPSLLIQADPNAGGMLIDKDADSLDEWTPDLTRVKVSGCGHLVHWTRTAELLNHVHAFLESVD